MSDFELIILGFFIGCIFTFVIAGTGVWFDYTRTNRRIFKGDSDMRIYIPKRSRDRSCDNGCDKKFTRAEMMCVLNELSKPGCKYEKEVAGYILKQIQKGAIK